ncbi:Hypothetical predicted protein [Lecanosticta acicola]|uniref:Mid2 domain-containing protein n=1 Tax=Lecanosticta acicola TaxID=111012 RepID=A0AAI8YRM4_9PEZI|nr:Hypothetical predicted protein [Lecanosticta acicola]
MVLFILLSALFLAVMASAQNTNYFITPPTPGDIHEYADNNVYAEGSTLELQWATNYSFVDLVLWQNDNSSYQTLIDDQRTTSSFSWNVNLTGMFSLNKGNVFFFEVFNGSTDTSFSSHYFNITAAAASSSSTPTSSSTATTTSSSTPASQTNNPSAVANSDSGLSTGAKAGIGVGVAIGALVLIGAGIAAFFLLRRRKGGDYAPAKSSPDFLSGSDQAMQQQHQYQAYQKPPTNSGELPSAPVYSPRGGYVAVPSQEKPVEMAASDRGPSELPAHQATHELMAPSPTTQYK